MFHSRIMLAFPVISLLLISLTACGGRHSADEHYVLVGANIKVPYWQAAGAGFDAGARQLQVHADFVGPDTYDPKAEVDAFNDAVQKKPAGILVAVADPAMMKDPIDRAIASGVPVITIDGDAPTSKRLFFIGTNNYQAGMAGGKRLAEELKDKGNVVVFTMPEQTNLAERLRGYRDALESHPQIKITQIVDIKGDPRIAFDTTTEILGKEKEKKDMVDAFVCLEALGGKEVANVLSSNKVNGKVIIAMDTDPDTLDWIQKGVIAATISQKPYTMAMVGLRALDDLYHSKLPSLETDWSKDSFSPLPAFVNTGSALIDKNNVQAFQQAQKSMTGAQK
jgi:ribose transport system substrate-binding protein